MIFSSINLKMEQIGQFFDGRQTTVGWRQLETKSFLKLNRGIQNTTKNQLIICESEFRILSHSKHSTAADTKEETIFIWTVNHIITSLTSLESKGSSVSPKQKLIQDQIFQLGITEKKLEEREGCFAGLQCKKCAKSSNSKLLQQIKMSYIQQFLALHLPQYYLSTINHSLTRQDFFCPTHPNSIFTLTTQLLTHFSVPSSMKHILNSFLLDHLWISYDCLKNFNLPICPSDSEIVRLMKQSLPYVQNTMLQLLLRLARIFMQCGQNQYLNNTTLELIQDVSYIYPLLKTEITINLPELSLADILHHFLTHTITHPPSQATIEALNSLKISCNLTGQAEKIVTRIIEEKKKELNNLDKKIEFSSNDSQEESDRQTKAAKDSHRYFNEAQTFRKKKLKIIKEHKLLPLKNTKSMSTIEATPISRKHDPQRKTPKSQKRQIKIKDENGQPVKKTPLFKKIKKQRKPFSRTLYQGETKKFIPKKGVVPDDIFSIKETLGGSHFDKFAFSQSYKKTQKKTPSHYEEVEEGMSMFCVPETPKVHMKKIFIRKMI